MDKVHPIRGAIALIMVLGTVAFIALGITIPIAWWPLVGGAVAFYLPGK